MSRKGLRLDGVVLLDKPSGFSSNAALQAGKASARRRQGRSYRDSRSFG
jgi:tRNA U55 pseudouridine synthase TruB